MDAMKNCLLYGIWVHFVFMIIPGESVFAASAAFARVSRIDPTCLSVLALPESEHPFGVPKDFTQAKAYKIAAGLKLEADRIYKNPGLEGEALAKALDAKEYRWMILWM